jgi:hypothetical protein
MATRRVGLSRNDYSRKSLLRTVGAKGRPADSSRYSSIQAPAYKNEEAPIDPQKAEEDIHRPPDDSSEDEEPIITRYDSSDDDTNPADILPSLGRARDGSRSKQPPETNSKLHTETSPPPGTQRRGSNATRGTPKKVRVGIHVSGSQDNVDMFGQIKTRTTKKSAMKYGSSQKGYGSSQSSKRSITDDQSTGDSSPKATFKPPLGKLSLISW